ncbi:Na(+)/H(+) antiporter subunit C [Brevibacterium samyangense]|uniref:Na(+)/H(+) antiporter subunit C n=1 Tax=Brevibacterium samyangense TaxID=366888 RepID=A0ABN2TBX7_9MICO
MTTSFVMLLTMGVLLACGIYLMLDRSLTRVLLGFLLMGNGINILIMLTAGPPGKAPFTDGSDFSTEGMSDPLPHALVLTAIVITFAMTAFLLALIYRSWRLVRNETIADDLEDARIALARRQAIDTEAETSDDYEDTEFGDEAEVPVPGALDLDDDGAPHERGTMDPPDDDTAVDVSVEAQGQRPAPDAPTGGGASAGAPSGVTIGATTGATGGEPLEAVGDGPEDSVDASEAPGPDSPESPAGGSHDDDPPHEDRPHEERRDDA